MLINTDLSIRAGAIAFCSLGCLGLITEDGMQEVHYADGTTGMAYVGIHLSSKIAPVGAPWSSRNPFVVCNIDDFKNDRRSPMEKWFDNPD